MHKIATAVMALFLVSGCSSLNENVKMLEGRSTAPVKESRKDALVKVFDCDRDTCYMNAENILKKVSRVSIYSKDKDLIALYYINPNTTPVGIFFTSVDSTHTKVEVSSPSRNAREVIAKCVFTDSDEAAAEASATAAFKIN